MTARPQGWARDVAGIGAALGICAGVGLLRYGTDVFRRQTAAFQLLTIGLAGSIALVGYRRGGWRGAILLAYLTLFLQYLLVGNLGRRESWPTLIGSVVGISCWPRSRHSAAIPYRVRWFILIADHRRRIRGGIAHRLVLRLHPIAASRGSTCRRLLAGAAMGLGLDVVDLIWRPAALKPSRL
jgi:hypothetical protein